MAIYRWVGSGNTGSTSANIFNWNHAPNWRKVIYFGPNKYFSGTTSCPGNGDFVVFGMPIDGNLFAGITGIEKTKSPCLFGGFVGSAAGGTWAGAATPYGTTLTSSILSLELDGVQIGGGLSASLPFGYNDSAYGLKNLPFGGGITSNNGLLTTNLSWIEQNYPNMGVTQEYTPEGGVTAGLPSGYNSSWDNLTLKVKNYATIKNMGTSNYSGVIDLNFITSYSQLGTAGNVVNTTLNVTSQKNVIIKGGAFKTLNARNIIDELNSGGPYVPDVYLDNLYAESLDLPVHGAVSINSGVRFINLTCWPKTIGTNGLASDGIGAYLANSNTISLYGSGSVSQVNSIIYPGNTANTNSLTSTVTFYLFNGSPFGTSGADDFFFRTNGMSMVNPSEAEWAQISTAFERYNEIAITGGLNDSQIYFSGIANILGESSAQNYGRLPYSHTLEIGPGVDGTTSCDIGRLVVYKNVQGQNQHVDYSIPVVELRGPANINEIIQGNYSYVSCETAEAKINIGEARLGSASTFNLQGSEDYVSVGVRGATGVTGGFIGAGDNDPYYNITKPLKEVDMNSTPMGKIVMPSDGTIRLFNVNTKKGGAIQVAESTIAEIAQVSGTNKKG
jgi:hypothetical protein